MRRRPTLLLGAALCLALVSTAEAASALAVLGGVASVGMAVIGGMLIKYNKLAPVYTPEPGSLKGQTILITGGNTGLGLESAKRLAIGGARIIVTTRSAAKGQAAVEQVQVYVKETTGQDAAADIVSYKVLQLDSLAAIRSAVASWTDIPTVDVLMNNAAMLGGKELQLSEDGMEVSFQTNHLGYFFLTALLKNKLSPKARIINVSSGAHASILSKQLEFDYIWNPPNKQDYGFWRSYSNSKLANIYFTQELQRRVNAAGKDWTVVACHPGVVSTDIWRSDDSVWKRLFDWLVLPTMRTTEQGATTQVWLAVGGGDDNDNSVDMKGQYFVDRTTPKLVDYAQDVEAAQRLWRESEERSGLVFDLDQGKASKDSAEYPELTTETA